MQHVHHFFTKNNIKNFIDYKFISLSDNLGFLNGIYDVYTDEFRNDASPNEKIGLFSENNFINLPTEQIMKYSDFCEFYKVIKKYIEDHDLFTTFHCSLCYHGNPLNHFYIWIDSGDIIDLLKYTLGKSMIHISTLHKYLKKHKELPRYLKKHVVYFDDPSQIESLELFVNIAGFKPILFVDHLPLLPAKSKWNFQILNWKISCDPQILQNASQHFLSFSLQNRNSKIFWKIQQNSDIYLQQHNPLYEWLNNSLKPREFSSENYDIFKKYENIPTPDNLIANFFRWNNNTFKPYTESDVKQFLDNKLGKTVIKKHGNKCGYPNWEFFPNNDLKNNKN